LRYLRSPTIPARAGRRKPSIAPDGKMWQSACPGEITAAGMADPDAPRPAGRSPPVPLSGRLPRQLLHALQYRLGCSPSECGQKWRSKSIWIYWSWSFEYVMAGLALCTTDLPEMARLIREYDLGVTIAAVEPKAIAAAVNALDPDRIDSFKRNALCAARELCWERESERLVGAYSAALAQAPLSMR
jgi:hypothetical protein